MKDTPPADELMQQVLTKFQSRCPVAFEWAAYSLQDPENPQPDDPALDGVRIFVRGGSLRLFDPLTGRWTPYEGSSLVFTVCGADCLLSVLLPDSEETRPLAPLRCRAEIATFVALHVEGALEIDGPPVLLDPIEEIMLPLPQFPDDEAPGLEGNSVVSVRHLSSLLAEHCRAGCPWLMKIDPEMKAWASDLFSQSLFAPDSINAIQELCEKIPTDARGLLQIRESIRSSARKLIDALPNDAFVRDYDLDQCVCRDLALFKSDDEITFPFIIRFNPEVFMPFAAGALSPSLASYVSQRVMLGVNLPDEAWDFVDSQEAVRRRTPDQVELPSFGDQVSRTFELRTLQFQMENDLARLYQGEVPAAYQEAEPRIAAMREIAMRLSGILE